MKITEGNIRKIIREELVRLFEQEEAKPKKLDDLEFKSDDRLEYERWARSTGHVSPEVQSTLVSYFINQNLQNSHELHQRLCDELGLNHDSVMAAMEGRLENEVDPSTEESDRRLDLAQVTEAIAELSRL